MVTMSLDGMDLGIFFKAVNSGFLNVNENGALECNPQTANMDSNAKDTIESLQNKVKELESKLAMYDTAEVEKLNSENDKLRNILSELVNKHEKLGNLFKGLEEENKKLMQEKSSIIESSQAIIPLQKENELLKEQLAKASNITSLQDSQEYKDLVESNQLLESTASRLTQENEALQKEISLLKANPQSNDSDKVAELESRLQKAKEVFALQKKEIEALKSSGGVDIKTLRNEIEKEVKDKANARLKEQWEKLIAQKDKEIEDKVKELANIQKIEIDQKNAQIKELESKVYSGNNAKGVPFGLVEFVDKAMPMIISHLNPTQVGLIERHLKEMAKDLTECYASDYKESQKENISDIVESDSDIGFKSAKEVVKAVVNPDDNGNPQVYTQEDLPF